MLVQFGGTVREIPSVRIDPRFSVCKWPKTFMEGMTDRQNKWLIRMISEEICEAVNIDSAIDGDKLGIGLCRNFHHFR
jgi:hypothetical protein